MFKQIKSLSGGERGRVSLAKLMLSEANFLILDEPTNHLDIMSKEILEDALNAYTGTVLYVSHDRYFVNRTASRILDLRDGTLTGYLGNYDYYLEKRQAETATSSGNAARSDMPSDSRSISGRIVSQTANDSITDGRQDWLARKEQQAAQRKKENELKKCEEQIEKLETRNREIDSLMASPDFCTDVAKLQELNREKETNDTALSDLYEKWELLSE